jgi:cyclohexadienyl dehydratase
MMGVTHQTDRPGQSKRILALATAMVLLFVSAQHAKTASSGSKASKLDVVAARGILRVGMPGDYLPFGLLDAASGRWQGLDVDVTSAMAKALGVKLELVKTSWPALLPDLLEDRFDIAAGGISITLERQKAAFFSTPILQDGKTPITRCENAAKFTTLSEIDRPGVRVITPPGGTNEAFDRAHLRHASIIVFPDNTRIFDELVAGLADLMITDATETRLQHKSHPELCSVHPDHPFDVGEKAYLLPRDAAFQQRIDEFLHIQMKNGELNATIHRWLD